MRRDEARRSRLSTLAWLAGACALVLTAAVAAPAPSLAAKVLDWGSNSVGQLGNGTTTLSDVPVAVTGLGAVKKLAEDGQSAFAVLKTAPSTRGVTTSRESSDRAPGNPNRTNRSCPSR
jgi:hypothetical protein